MSENTNALTSNTENNSGVSPDDSTEALYNDLLHPVEDNVFERSYFLPKKAAANLSLDNSSRVKACEVYEEAKSNKTILEATVNQADPEGNLHIPLQNGLSGVVLYEDVNDKPYDVKKKHFFVGRTFLVVVKEVDVEKGIIYFSRKDAKAAFSVKLKEHLRKSVSTGGVTVKARVLYVYPTNHRVYIDIGGCGLVGYVPISEWSHGYVYNPDAIIKKDDIIDVVVMKYHPAKGPVKDKFICSRKAAMPDPWVGIAAKYPKDTALLVQARDIRDNKFYGSICGANFEIDVYCELPDPGRSNIIVRLGHYYSVAVYNVDENRKVFRARVISEVNAPLLSKE